MTAAKYKMIDVRCIKLNGCQRKTIPEMMGSHLVKGRSGRYDLNIISQYFLTLSR